MGIFKNNKIKKAVSRYAIVQDKASRAELIGRPVTNKRSLLGYRGFMTGFTVCLTLLWNTTALG